MNSDIQVEAANDYETTLSSLDNKYGRGTCSYNDIENMAQEMLSTIPRLNRNKLRQEMAEMHVEVYTEPTTFSINEGLAKAQAYRERLAGILALAEREFNIRSKVLDMLAMANSVLSKASSADKRRGEVLLKYPSQFIYLEAAETFKDEVALLLKNMQSTSETISRQASVLQSQITLGEIRRRDITIAEEITNRAPTVLQPIQEVQW